MTVSDQPAGSSAVSVFRRPWQSVAELRAIIATQPSKIFFLFAAFHLLLWTIIPAITSPNAPLDVIEGYSWGREWPIGTYKHPPMQAWWLEILALLTGRAGYAHFLASQIAVVAAFWAVWQTGRRIMDPRTALVGVLMLEGILYYNFLSPEFNPNILQLPFWALICWSFHRAVKEGKLIDWLLLGVWFAGGMYTKYSTVLLVMVLGLWMLWRPEARRRVLTFGPYAAALVATLLFLPHFIWIAEHHFAPISYVQERAATALQSESYFKFFTKPANFVLNQMLVLLPLVLFSLLAFDYKGKRQTPTISRFDRSFLDAVAFGPLIMAFLLSCAFGLCMRDMWGTPFWNFIGLWLVARFPIANTNASMRRFSYGFGTVCCGLLLAAIIGKVAHPYMVHKAQRVHFPGDNLAMAVSEGWHARYSEPLRYAIGDTWPAGNVAYYTPERPHLLIEGNYSISHWINPGDVQKYGGVIVWCVQNCSYSNHREAPPDYLKSFPQENLEMQTPITLRRLTGADVPAVTIGWAILKPAVQKHASNTQ